MRVLVTVRSVTLTNSNGHEVDSIEVTCDRCDYSVEVFGTSDASTKRGCVMLREECPGDEENFYEEE